MHSLALVGLSALAAFGAPVALDTKPLQAYAARFAEEDRWYFQVATDAAVSQVNNGVYGGQHVKNAEAFAWLAGNIPLADFPDTTLLRTYYYRWWTFRKHLKNIGTAQSPSFVITEYIDPVPWSDGATNSIAAPLGHHLYEARWLRDPRFSRDYGLYWLKHSVANPRRYSSWLADALWASHLVHPDTAQVLEALLSTANRLNLVKNWNGWKSASAAPGGNAQVAFFEPAVGLFWQNTDRDAMEVSLTGDGYKPSLNAYLYGDARAIASAYRLAAAVQPGNAAAHLLAAESFEDEAQALKKNVQSRSWDPGRTFFMNGYYGNGTFTRAAKREAVGFTPWAFMLPDDGGPVDFDRAWMNTVTNPAVFRTAYGLTSGGRDESGFNSGSFRQCCRWDGPIWPYATALTLKGFANLLRSYNQAYVSRADYFQELSTYAASHQNRLDRGGQTRTISWIDEALTANTGQWVHILFNDDITKPRGYSYNHSTFNDLVIADLVGLRPRADDTVEVNPLAPSSWRHFALDEVAYHGHRLAILWDQDGTKYGLGPGLSVYVDGRLVARRAALGRILVALDAPTVSVKRSLRKTSHRRPAATWKSFRHSLSGRRLP